ncbi:Alpha/Beta hydrolase protein [Crepidotus variabilis]|uniref:Dipeptidyl-peptidase V n=1 Tax=Crepidotus variabilis TaxID=179855 RepID=A0A9P6EPW9_9AGAR|nr:Alpha/Beta hydrolase protein [Crepidotus variabilis]
MNMRFPLVAYFGLASQLQVPVNPPSQPVSSPAKMADQNPDFAFKEAADIFSPKDLVQLGRPGAAVASPDGDLAIVSYSQYSFQDKKNEKSVYILPISSSYSKKKPAHITFDKGGETFWLSSRTFAHVVADDDDSKVYTYDVSLDGHITTSESAHIGSIPAKDAGNFKYNTKTGNLVFSANVYEDGDLSNVKEKDKAWDERGTTALVYDDTYVRHWDVWQGKKGPQLFVAKITKGDNGKWSVAEDIKSPLKGSGHYSPVEPFGGTDDFDASEDYIAYTAKDPDLPNAWHTKQNVYIVPISGYDRPKALTSGQQGATHSVVFSNSGTKVAWTELDKDGYESDRAKIVIFDLKKLVRFTVTQHWDRSAGELVFSKDDKFLYLTAGEHARVKVFALPVAPTPDQPTTHPKLGKKYSIPVALTNDKAASGLQALPNGRILFSQSSLTSPNNAYVVNGLEKLQEKILTQQEGQEALKPEAIAEKVTAFAEEELSGKHLSEGEEFWFRGADGKHVQGWTLKPKGWKEGQKKQHPGLLLIHGGPQGAWEDQWSTRWNPNVFAQQGYFVIMINPTGSTTFGQDFTDAIAEDWGGKPFVDLIAGWKYILTKHPEIDADRAVAAGASWGGYAINWIQGHPEFGFNFKALVCHDGVFDSTYNGYSTDELFFFNHEWGGRPWEPKSKALSEKMSPANFVSKWSTPQLLIHGSKDYRLPETEGIGAFHALQQLGIPSRLVIFPDENHWVLNPGNSLKWHYEVLKWFDQFVGEKRVE